MPFSKHKLLIFLLILAFLRGALYALFMPPWGLLDEEQHFDYVTKLLTTGKPPVTGVDTLEPSLLASILETQRHRIFHWPTPPSADPQMWGLEGYSYEGYQGPLFYLLCAPIYQLIPGSLLDKLFGLRLWMVILSLITVAAAYRITRGLYPEDQNLAGWVAFLIVCLPERTGSTGRLSNDVLLEVISILFLWVSIRAALQGISWKRAVWIGILAGLGMLTKISFIGVCLLPFPFILHLKKNGVFLKGLLSALLAGLISGPYFYYSYRVYGDLTGFRGFADLYQSLGGTLWNPVFSPVAAAETAWKIFGSFWFVWWGDNGAVYTLWLQIVWVALLGLVLTAMWGLWKRRQPELAHQPLRFWTLLSFLGLIIAFVGLTGLGYFQGKYPTIQGRFLLPVLYPISLLIVLGLKNLRAGKILLSGLCGFMLCFDGLLLFGNLLPYHYYYSEFYANGQWVGSFWSGWRAAITLFLTNLVSDKPLWSVAAGILFLTAYLFGLLGAAWRRIHP